MLGQFFRGQFTVMAILAVLYSVGYGVIGVPLALPIGIMAGVLSFIPYVGSTLALATALLMTALDWQGWTQILWVLGVHAVIQGLEGFVITPKIMGDTVGISAIAVLFALLVGAELLGFTGVLARGAGGRGHQDPAPAHRRAVPQVRVLRQRAPMGAALPSRRKTRHVERHLDRAPRTCTRADCSTSSMAVPRCPVGECGPSPDERCVLGGELRRRLTSMYSVDRLRASRLDRQADGLQPLHGGGPSPSFATRSSADFQCSGGSNTAATLAPVFTVGQSVAMRERSRRVGAAPRRTARPPRRFVTDPVTMVRSSSSAIALRRSRLARTGPAGPSRRTIEPPRVSTSKR